MGKYDDMLKSKGEICRWLTEDDMLHMVDCKLNIERMYVLMQRFRDLGFKHTEFAWEYVVRWCQFENCPYFESRKDGDHEVVVDKETDDEDIDIRYTALEKAVEDKAIDEFKDDGKVRETYLMLKDRYLKRRREDLEKQLKALEAIQGEKE